MYGSAPPLTEQRLYGLDALRGLAALAVFIWHFNLIASVGQGYIGQKLAAPPAFAWLWPFYEHGWMAVDLFFCLSGFVFFGLYERAVREGSASFGLFFTRRISRLYPLHLVTLVFVAVAQRLYEAEVGQYFVYDQNDLRSFGRNLLMMDRSFSFNGPFWSVSVEFLLYIAFFFLAGQGMLKGWKRSAAIAAAAVLLGPLDPYLLRGVAGFFIGGVVFRLWRRLAAPARTGRIDLWLIAGCLLAWALTLIEGRVGLAARLASAVPGPWAGALASEAGARLVMHGVMPLTVLAVALWEGRRAVPLRGAAWLGEISYAVYLLHFPLLLVLAYAVVVGWIDRGLAQSGWALAVLTAVLVPLSFAVHHLFERPAQAWLRRSIRAAPLRQGVRLRPAGEPSRAR